MGYNYRLPNLNAALGCAQMERLPEILAIKADVAARYAAVLTDSPLKLVQPLQGSVANNWLNAVILENRQARDEFLKYTNSQEVMTRPIWQLMHQLEMFTHCQHDGLPNSIWLADRLINLPSSVPENALEGYS